MRILSAILAILVTVSAQADTYKPPKYEPITYEDIKSLIETKNVKSIAELLPLLPAYYRSRFTLVQKSRSLQEASVDFPRVIMFGLDAKLMIAFNGQPGQVGYDKLEVTQFRDQGDKFEYFEIQFPEKDATGKALNELTAPQFSKVNPTKCLSCHTSDPRPNWEHYSTWPGVFMGQDDTGNVDTEYHEAQTQLPIMLAKFPQHARYKYLERLKEGYDGTDSDDGRPSNKNISLTQSLAFLNFRRINRLLRETPYFNSYKYLIVSTISYYSYGIGFKSYVPDNFPTIDLYSAEGPSDFYNLFQARGLFMEDYTMDFKSLTHNMETPLNFSGSLLYALAADDPDLKNLMKYTSRDAYGFEVHEAQVADSAHLAELSRAALQNTPPPADEIAAREIGRPTILKKCMSCHTAAGLAGPHIPFDQPERFAKFLQTDGYTRGRLIDEMLYRISDTATMDEQMPPKGISAKDRAELVQYLKGISN
jgi:mono/diheme cytochrome c family protein